MSSKAVMARTKSEDTDINDKNIDDEDLKCRGPQGHCPRCLVIGVENLVWREDFVREVPDIEDKVLHTDDEILDIEDFVI